VPTFAISAIPLRRQAPCSTIPAIRRKRSKASRLLKKILAARAPGELPIEQPTRFNLFHQSETAKSLGIELSQTLIEKAFEVQPRTVAGPQLVMQWRY